MAAAKCAAAAVVTVAGIAGTAARAPARAATAPIVAASTRKTTQTTTEKAVTAGPTAGLSTPAGSRAYSRLAASPGTVTSSAGVEILPLSAHRPGVLLSPDHLLCCPFSRRSEAVCASRTRRLSTYSRFAQQLRSRYSGSPSVPAATSAAAVKDSPPSCSGGSDGRSKIASSTSAVQQRNRQFDVNGQQVFVSSTSTIPGYTIVSYKGFVQGCSVQARDMLLMAKVFLLVQLGGEVEDLASLIQRAKREAVERVCAEAAAVGANAVVGVRLVSSGTHQRTAVEFSAYGTAVLVKKAL